MSNNVVIKVENVSKKFSHSLKQMMYCGVKDIAKGTLGLPSNSDKLRKGEFWAVDDVSFELKRGETLGIIGPNGSGKTTILKMLNGILMPDRGSIEIKGKVGALIEIGAGFHPMLTGRENIYINGAVLGMSKKEIDKKFDSIIEFADIGDFLDSPVKHYSSGMYVRLGFAVAVHCEPDILLIDEILAVGDMSFRMRCLERISDLRKKGITMVFVSHDLYSVDAICSRAIFLNYGKIKEQGEASKIIQAYQNYVSEEVRKGIPKDIMLSSDSSSKGIEITNVQFFDEQGKEKDGFYGTERMVVRVSYSAYRRVQNPIFSIGFSRSDGLLCCAERTKYHGIEIEHIEGEGSFEAEFERVQLSPGVYTFGVAIFDSTATFAYVERKQDIFQVKSPVLPTTADVTSVFTPLVKWKIK
jgi:lipopolysaccharide transport system ATP-binding protein